MAAEGTERADIDDVTNLGKIEHIVVVMLENRSFDHMLGYLSLVGGRTDIDGLRPGLVNEHDGRTYPIHHLDTTALDVDPDHSAAAIDRQIAGGQMSGFVTSLAQTLADRGVPGVDPGVVMGYYDSCGVPVYDHLAREFAECTRWFSSVPGATLPNRLYALAGGAAGSRTTWHGPGRRCTTRRRSSGTWTPTGSRGGGTASTPGRCAWPTPTTCWAARCNAKALRTKPSATIKNP